MLDGSTATNIPTGAKRWNETKKQFEKFNGSTWTALVPDATTSASGLMSAADKTKVDALKTGSSTDKQTSVTDATAGRLLINAAFGLAGASAPTALSAAGALNTIAQTSAYIVAFANVATVNGPSGAGTGVVFTLRYSSTYAVQHYFNVDSGYRSWSRQCNNGAWSAWVENLHTGNIAPTHIPEDATHRWATDAEKTAWNAKSDASHNHTLDGLSNTTITSNTAGEILKWSGTAWVNNTLAEAGIAAASHTHADYDKVPPGTVIFFAGATLPSGYLKANGATVSRTTYASLYSAIGTRYGAGDGSTTFKLPDLRGEFVRGWDDSRGVDSGRNLGTAQDDAFESHTHNIAAGTDESDVGPKARGAGTTTTTGTVVTEATGSTETRPRNIALMACIKY